jgi:hypothetical protein
MNRFATLLRFAVLLVVAIACGLLSRLIPSPYHEFSPMSASRIQEVSASDSADEMIESAQPKYDGVDVDMNRLTYASTLS